MKTCRRLLNGCHLTLVDGIHEHDIATILGEMERTELLSLAETNDIKSCIHVCCHFKLGFCCPKYLKKESMVTNRLHLFCFLLNDFSCYNICWTTRTHFWIKEIVIKIKTLNIEESLQSNSTTLDSLQAINTECKICMHARVSVAFITRGPWVAHLRKRSQWSQ